METYSIDIKNVLIGQLKEKGVALHTIPRIIKDLTISFSDNPSLNLFQANTRLHLLGWDDVKLDYHTFQLAKANFENDSMKHLLPQQE